MDIDIDVKPSLDVSNVFATAINAMMVNNDGTIKKHPVGYYFQDIPTDPITSLSAIPYKRAESMGYYKIDFLSLNMLDHFASKSEIRTLLEIEPDWDLLLDSTIYDRLFQLGRHYSLVSILKPRSVPALADCIALLRPGKRKLTNEYIAASPIGRNALRKALYEKPKNGEYYFKKSHATAYALTIKLQLHLFTAQLI